MTNNICPRGREHRLTVSPSSVISWYHGFYTLREASRYNLPLLPVKSCLILLRCCWCSVAKSCLTLQPHGLQHSRLACPSLSPGVCSKLCSLSQWCHPAISSSVVSPSPPAPNPFQHQGLFQWVNSSHEVAKVLEFQLQHHSFQRNPRADLLQNGLVGSPCCPRDSQEYSPTLQFKSINSSALSLLHSPTLTSIHDHWKNHSLD